METLQPYRAGNTEGGQTVVGRGLESGDEMIEQSLNVLEPSNIKFNYQMVFSPQEARIVK